MNDEPQVPVGWGDRVAFSDEGVVFAYRPNELVVSGAEALDRVNANYPGLFVDVEPVFPDLDASLGPVTQRFLVRGEFDVTSAVHELRDAGEVVQPNHVLFSHGDCCCRPHPALVWASPLHASPLHASPLHASPLHASPLHASPLHASHYQATGVRRSSARPCGPPRVPWRRGERQPGSPRVAVLDTGFASSALQPAALGTMQVPQQQWEEPDEDLDTFLDPAAGHGTFITGIIEQLAPGCDLHVERVLTTYGDGDEVAIARRILDVGRGVDLLNLSFGGHALEHPRVLAAAIRWIQAAGTVVVASAGNDSSCTPAYPAALPGVVGVGALGPHGPAWFTNYGPWVRASAPGVDIVSSFFKEFKGAGQPGATGGDPDNFASWAVWSGSSFAAPVVVAALVREMRASGLSAPDAVKRVIDAPGLLRIPDLGTVVNLA